MALKLPVVKKIIVTTGRISELKGWKFMLDCFVKFKETNHDSIFIFIGDGEDRLKVESYIKHLNISDSVIITGRVNHNVLANYLNATDIYIMGSYIEGWATSLVEAISCAKPVVCTDFSSACDLIESDINGFVIENRNVDSFVEAMQKCENILSDTLIQHSKKMILYSASNLKKNILDFWKLK